MDADEERNFAALLSQSTALPSRPTWSPTISTSNANNLDPWANPFASSPTDPFAASTSASLPTFTRTPEPAPANPYDDYNVTGTGGNIGTGTSTGPEEDSPYIKKLEEEQIVRVEPPSVIAAREQEQEGFGGEEAFESVYQSTTVPSTSTSTSDWNTAYTPPTQPISDTSTPAPVQQADANGTPKKGSSRLLPADLIDEDLMAASDPSISLKKAFVKTAPTPTAAKTTGTPEKKGAYVFRPAGRSPVKASSKEDVEESKTQDKTVGKDQGVEGKEMVQEAHGQAIPKENGKATPAMSEDKGTESVKLTTSDEPVAPKQPEMNEVPPESATTSPPSAPTKTSAPHLIPLPDSAAPTRTTTPLPPAPSPPIPAETPTQDRVAVSPLEPPSAQIADDFGFKSLSIGGSAPVDGWGETATGSRFGGKGWGALDRDNEEGLFGRGGPMGDPWGNTGGDAWGSTGVQEGMAGPSSPPAPVAPIAEVEPIVSPSKPRRKTHPVFTISISDPARIGDPVRGYTVYTLRTRTTSPHYRRSELTALRRFSDFLWLFDSLIANNPGIIVPPVPDKHTFGRFQEQFIETRRLALERSLNKIASHPVLQLDPDLRLFLESDNFNVEKQRRPDEPTSSKGLLGGWNTPKFIENDDWFTSRNAFLDALENQLKSLSKSIEIASKSRLDMATSYAEVSASLINLAESDLGSAMCASLGHLADLHQREKRGEEELAKGEVVNLLNMADEYIRFVASVRRAMSGRVKSWLTWQGLEREVGRLKGVREKARVQGKLGDRAAQTLAEINEVDRRSRLAQQEYDQQTKLVKSEFARFERERVDEFKRVLERYLEAQIAREREVIMAWEEYHASVLGMVRRAQGVKEAQAR